MNIVSMERVVASQSVNFLENIGPGILSPHQLDFPKRLSEENQLLLTCKNGSTWYDSVSSVDAVFIFFPSL